MRRSSCSSFLLLWLPLFFAGVRGWTLQYTSIGESNSEDQFSPFTSIKFGFSSVYTPFTGTCYGDSRYLVFMSSSSPNDHALTSSNAAKTRYSEWNNDFFNNFFLSYYESPVGPYGRLIPDEAQDPTLTSIYTSFAQLQWEASSGDGGSIVFYYQFSPGGFPFQEFGSYVPSIPNVNTRMGLCMPDGANEGKFTYNGALFNNILFLAGTYKVTSSSVDVTQFSVLKRSPGNPYSWNCIAYHQEAADSFMGQGPGGIAYNTKHQRVFVGVPFLTSETDSVDGIGGMGKLLTMAFTASAGNGKVVHWRLSDDEMPYLLDEQTLLPGWGADPQGAGFGFSMATDRDILLVSAPNRLKTGDTDRLGCVNVYTIDDVTGLTLLTTLEDGSTGPFKKYGFGYDVGVADLSPLEPDGTWTYVAAVGHPRYPGPGGEEFGRVFVFAEDALAPMSAAFDGSNPYEHMGYAVELNHSILAFGKFRNHAPQFNTASFYRFDIDCAVNYCGCGGPTRGLCTDTSGDVNDGFYTCICGTQFYGDHCEFSICSPGTYANGSPPTACIACPFGYYCPDTDALSPMLCPEGYACGSEGLPSPQYPCSAGTYAPAGSSVCAACTRGSYCASSAMGSPTPCDIGKYSSTLSATSSTVCLNCTAGSYCPSTGMSTPTACNTGTYSTATSATSPDTCVQCPAGSYCATTGLSSLSLCATGKFSTTLGATTSATCQNCPSGTYCASTGMSTVTNCSVGTYSAATSATSPATCSQCAAGTYCADAGMSTPSSCATGKYSSTVGATTPNTCLNCFAGAYCASVGLSTATNCSVGRYSDVVGANSSATCLVCTAGYYCPTTATTTPVACLAGTFNSLTGANSSFFCTECNIGSFCNVSGLSSPFQCQPGRYCPNSGLTTSGLPCPIGNYSNLIGASSCLTCPITKFCNESGLSLPFDCLPGRYCPITGLDAPIPCQLGRFGSSYSLSTCTNCTYGTYSDVQASITCSDADDAYYVPDLGATTQLPCPAGYSCHGPAVSIPQPCAPGRFSGEAQSSCDQCDVGTFADTQALSVCEDCEAGYYCPFSGLNASLLCSPGYYCEDTGMTSQTPCSPGSFNPNAGQTSCDPCGVGFYCSGEGRSNRTVCPTGYHCPSGEMTTPTICPANTFCPDTGMNIPTPCVEPAYSGEGATSCLDCDSSDCPFFVGGGGLGNTHHTELTKYNTPTHSPSPDVLPFPIYQYPDIHSYVLLYVSNLRAMNSSDTRLFRFSVPFP